MKRKLVKPPVGPAVVVGVACIFAGGCVGGPHARTGTAVGTLAGGALGAAAGSGSHKSLEGAAIGAVAGGLLGGAVGNAADRDEAAWDARQVAWDQQVRATAMTTDQVIQMTHAGLSEQVIANQIRSQGVIAPLSTSDLLVLKQNGVSDLVIAAWQQTPPVGNSPPPVETRPVIVRERWAPPPWEPCPWWYDPYCHPHYHSNRVGLHFRF